MRLSLTLALTALLLGACRNDRADEAVNEQAGLTADNIVSNDVTAIDAVTADAANMAADVDYSDMLANLSNNASDSGPRGSGAAPRPRPNARPNAAPPAANETSATNAQ